MVSRNITEPFRFVCVTDQVVEGIDTHPLDYTKHVPGTTFLRLMLHDEALMRSVGPRILSLDLDLVVTGNLDHLVRRTEDFVILRNPNYGKPRRAFYQSSIQLLTVGARQQIWSDFYPKETPSWMNWRFGAHEQAWISECLPWDEAFFSASDGVYCSGRNGGEGVYESLPDNACIVSVPGLKAPWLPETQADHPWIKEHYR
jgi:hypothetical protein